MDSKQIWVSLSVQIKGSWGKKPSKSANSQKSRMCAAEQSEVEIKAEQKRPVLH